MLATLLLLGSSGCVVVGTEVGGGRDAAPAGEPPAASSDDAPRAVEREIFDRVNAEREERGLRPVAWDDDLAELARGWSREMADRGQLRHQDLRTVLQDRQVEGYASLGENIFSRHGCIGAAVGATAAQGSEGLRAARRASPVGSAGRRRRRR